MSFPTYVRDPESKRVSRERFKAATVDPDPLNAKILKLIVDMGNTVLSKRAAADLHRSVHLSVSMSVTNALLQYQSQASGFIPPGRPFPKDAYDSRKPSLPVTCSTLCFGLVRQERDETYRLGGGFRD